jgi:hypothetical protein
LPQKSFKKLKFPSQNILKKIKIGEKMADHEAFLCNDCGFGSGKDNCVKCGAWIASSGVPAKICDDCAFGSGADNCVKCGNWLGSTKFPAFICSDCAFGSGADLCVKCGK